MKLEDILKKYPDNLIRQYVNGDKELTDTPLMEELYEFYSSNGEMPYGTVTGDDELPEDWILERLSEKFCD